MKGANFHSVYSFLKRSAGDVWGVEDREVLVWKVLGEHGDVNEILFVAVGSPPVIYGRYQPQWQCLQVAGDLSGAWRTVPDAVYLNEGHMAMLSGLSVLVPSKVNKHLRMKYESQGYRVIPLSRLRMLEEL